MNGCCCNNRRTGSNEQPFSGPTFQNTLYSPLFPAGPGFDSGSLCFPVPLEHSPTFPVLRSPYILPGPSPALPLGHQSGCVCCHGCVKRNESKESQTAPEEAENVDTEGDIFRQASGCAGYRKIRDPFKASKKDTEPCAEEFEELSVPERNVGSRSHPASPTLPQRGADKAVKFPSCALEPEIGRKAGVDAPPFGLCQCSEVDRTVHTLCSDLGPEGDRKAEDEKEVNTEVQSEEPHAKGDVPGDSESATDPGPNPEIQCDRHEEEVDDEAVYFKDVEPGCELRSRLVFALQSRATLATSLPEGVCEDEVYEMRSFSEVRVRGGFLILFKGRLFKERGKVHLRGVEKSSDDSGEEVEGEDVYLEDVEPGWEMYPGAGTFWNKMATSVPKGVYGENVYEIGDLSEVKVSGGSLFLYKGKLFREHARLLRCAVGESSVASEAEEPTCGERQAGRQAKEPLDSEETSVQGEQAPRAGVPQWVQRYYDSSEEDEDFFLA